MSTRRVLAFQSTAIVLNGNYRGTVVGMAEDAKPSKERGGKILAHPIVVLFLAPLLVIVVGYFVLKWIEGPESDGPPDIRIDAAASLVNPTTDTAAAEYICLVSEEGSAVSLTGWKLADAEGTVNVLPQFSLGPQARVRIHPGGGDERTDTTHDLYGESGASWNNDGDTVTLLDADGTPVDSVSYGNREDGEVRGTCGPRG